MVDTPMTRIKMASALVVLEAVALGGLGVAELFAIDSGRLELGLTNVVFFLLYAVGLGFAAWGFSHTRSWSRGPVVIAQLIQLGVAWGFVGNGLVPVALALALPALAVLVVVFSPSTTQALYGVRPEDDGKSPS